MAEQYIKKINGYFIKDVEARAAAEAAKNTANSAASAAATAQTTATETATNLNLFKNTVAAELDKKQNNLTFDGTYNATSNKVATVSTVTKKIAEVIADAPEAFDTLKEIADYIASDKTGAANMNTAISKNATAIEGVKSRLSDVETTTAGHTSKISEIKTNITALGNAVNSNKEEIQNQTITLKYKTTDEELLILKNGTQLTPTVV